ncbi:MAG: peroxiredoxin [Pseudobdellovibrionaceae bacterium]
MLETGQIAPAFSARYEDGTELSLEGLRGQTVILYFYPKDDTPGCTVEACTFSENLSAFNDLKAHVIGVSKDSMESHKKFRDKYGINFTLLSDPEGKLCEAYGVWIEKSMYGRKYMGIDRSTFVIAPDGIIKALWRGVKVPGHIGEVIKSIAP